MGVSDTTEKDWEEHYKDYIKDCCNYCKHCYDNESWSCDLEEPCINGNMFEEKEPKEKFNEIEN